MSTHEARLKALREQLKADRLDGFVVPICDEHMSEYVGAYAQRLAWLTGFQGSAGSAAILPEDAAIFVDGRYTLQVRDQVDGNLWQYQSVPQTSVAAWLGEHAPEGGRIGYDPWLHTKAWVEQAKKALAERGAELVAVDTNPVDKIWPDQPEPSKAKLVVHPEELAGRNAHDKRQEIADWLHAHKADAVILSALDSIAWTFNIRGKDVERTPVALAYAIVHEDATADFYVAPEKMADDVAKHLGNAVQVHDRGAFAGDFAKLKGKHVVVDPERAVSAIFAGLEAAGAIVHAMREPVVLAKAIKNPVEIAGHRAAQARDGAALSRFLRWISVEAPKGGETEISAQDKLLALREETGLLQDLSFDTISGAGPNGAVVHYRVSEETNRPLEMNSLYLVDSGGQYRDGTTDVTRTVPIGEPTQEMRDRFTRVLKGHIALARAIFPAGTRGGQLDTLARQYLWEAGLDYAHGTGHGVGSFLSVHEGPQRIAMSAGGQAGTDEPLRAGMILSNEPGYYKTDAYGIRIENLVLVVEKDVPGAEKPVLGFETLTFAPIERRLIDASMLSPVERQWVDDYHGKVLEIVGPQLEGADKAWLEAQCAAL
ncbi:aminopeptidase P family protein [Sphingomonas sp. LaA6.9]|uniref:aminopeptidase P family protein n=1 Tax=Sphingomonas sp. LaA6.9 TaxID=2919914 RepID=UPI001F4FD655|nr:aminopeptidase P family protein [Sphingomonas sp. LaA6.9]MCJ8156237.1 aminopeptidase P family protein [Sphingomonas sp. LaA6.9]